MKSVCFNTVIKNCKKQRKLLNLTQILKRQNKKTKNDLRRNRVRNL